MPIQYHSETQSFFIHTPKSTYALQIAPTKHLCHLYYGKRVATSPLPIPVGAKGCLSAEGLEKMNGWYALERVRQEYSTGGTSELKEHSLSITNEAGFTASELFYKSHHIEAGKPTLPGLPATYAENNDEADTLIITLEDPVLQIEVDLYYTAYTQRDVITRSARIHNKSKEQVTLNKAMSLCIDFAHSDFDLLHLSGAWSREQEPTRRRLVHGQQQISSQRGPTSHQHNPFIALLEPSAHETQGEVYAFSLVYSGNFIAEVQVDEFGFSRTQLGINPNSFRWHLAAGETFVTPEVVCVFSDAGLEQMSHTFHELYRSRLCRGQYRDAQRPIVVNTWEAVHFEFDSEKILSFADSAKELGIEMLVIDDGWFGKRDAPTSSLGDWVTDTRKIPEGIAALTQKVVDKGIKIGLWFEPEMVSPDSDLYRKHPDWCLHVPGRRRTVGRDQLVLDLSRKDVQDYIIEAVSKALAGTPITYVKWDFNRPFYEVGSALLSAEHQGEVNHRYMLGLYRVLETLVQAHPHILIEGCAGGGGRNDPGMLYYIPQTWTSDNTDAVDRLGIQYSTSLVYPTITLGSHVSPHLSSAKRRLSLELRGQVASMGRFGYELDITQLTEDEKAIVKAQITFYQAHRELVQHGTFHRLLNPYEGEKASWMFVSQDKNEALVFCFQKLFMTNRTAKPLRLRGLALDKHYQVTTDNALKTTTTGDVLMHVGLMPDLANHDFSSRCWQLSSKD